VIWYAARAGGILAYLLLSASSVLGLMLARKRTPPRPKFAVEDVHRYLTILTGIFLAVHVGAVLVDDFVPFSLGQTLVPFTADYRPFATGLGVVALELLLAVALTNAVRRRIPRRLWRRAHYLTFGVWASATVHGLLAGTDRHELWFLLLTIGAVSAVAAAGAARFAPDAPDRALAAAAVATVLAAVLAALPEGAA
jgi:sulfoxide reductase heme-binding subunit YedZ